jgi:hypothetical protein
MPSRALLQQVTPSQLGTKANQSASPDQTNPILIRGSLMAVTQIADVIVPTIFQNYITENRLVSTALFQSGVAVQNGEMAAQLSAAAQSFRIGGTHCDLISNNWLRSQNRDAPNFIHHATGCPNSGSAEIKEV